MKHLWTPWRMDYVSGKGKDDDHDSCLFCQLSSSTAADGRTGVIARSSHSFAVLNRYPYTYGHTMIVPFEHVSSPEDLHRAALSDLAAYDQPRNASLA